MIEQSPKAINHYLTVSQLNGEIRALVEDHFPFVRVRGEVSGLRMPASGHAYFSLVDPHAQVRAVIWKATLQRLPHRPQEGEAVLITGRIALYEPRGEYQVVVDGLKPDGLGDERERLLERHRRLAAQGLFDPERKRPLPFFPEVIGVVTSASGAALQDIRKVLDENGLPYRLLLAPARVQGENAAREIVAALARLNADGRAQVIICGRGGGSAEDLAAFNEEAVVQAVAASRIPVVSAVGHEVDITLADLAADLRAPTPSAAARQVMPDRAFLLGQISALGHRLQRAMEHTLLAGWEQLDGLRERMRNPREKVDQGRLRLDDLNQRLHRAMEWRLRQEKGQLVDLQARLGTWSRGGFLATLHGRAARLDERLKAACARMLDSRRSALQNHQASLHALSPLAVLTRGYAIVRDDRGRILKEATQTTPDAAIRITLAAGELGARVTDLTPAKE